jgi:hypothetical protein
VLFTPPILHTLILTNYLDTFVLLEKAIAAAKSSDFNLLLQYSTQLQKLSKMIAHIALHTNFTKFYEDERPKFNHRLDNHVIIMHGTTTNRFPINITLVNSVFF